MIHVRIEYAALPFTKRPMTRWPKSTVTTDTVPNDHVFDWQLLGEPVTDWLEIRPTKRECQFTKRDHAAGLDHFFLVTLTEGNA
jgi:hypothetical protein